MTAVGFIFLLVGIAIGWLDDCFYLPEPVEAIGAILVFLGLVFTTCGIALWLWNTLP